jgi:hypothetical protein
MTFTVRGVSFHNSVSGEGQVAYDAGVLVFELLSFDLETGDFEIGALLHSGASEGIDWCPMVD